MLNLDDYLNEAKIVGIASPIKRVCAYLIDIFFIFLIIITASLVILLFKETISPQVFEWLYPVIIMIVSLFYILYLFFKDGFHGQSLGKKIIRIQVINIETKKPIGFWRSALRMLFVHSLGFLELIIIFIQPNHRRLGDLISKTIVVNK